MAELATERMVVTATPEQCFAVVSDIERYPEWAADIKQVAGRAARRRGPAGRGHLPGRGLRPVHQLHPRLRLLEAPATLAWKQTAGDLTSKLDGSYRFDAAGDGSTEVTYTLEVELRVPLPGFIKRRAQSRIMHTALEELKARVESSLTT